MRRGFVCLISLRVAKDAYGVPVGFDPAAAHTTLLHSGEQFDQRIAMQYLRARYYNPASGTFNRLDPFFGRLQDPQSLHKYLYVYGDPVNFDDPTGLCEGLNGLMSAMSSMGRTAASVGRARLQVLRRFKFTAMGLATASKIATAMHAIGHKGFTIGEGTLIGSQLGAAMDLAASPRGMWQAFLGDDLND